MPFFMFEPPPVQTEFTEDDAQAEAFKQDVTV
jgi:hypothetical protein